MLQILKKTWLGLLLIGVAIAVLLASDLGQRNAVNQPIHQEKHPDIAVVQFVSSTVLDESVAAIEEELVKASIIKPDESNVSFFNAEGDFSVANAIAAEVVDGDYDLLVTVSTPMLQLVANANAERKKPHVFCSVTDPYGAGVGITGEGKDEHPPHLVGVGTFQPVEKAFQFAKMTNPKLKRVGVIWNPSEKCSEACLKKARPACKKLGIELVEVNASSPSEFQDVFLSLASSDIEAVWIGGDNIALAATKIIVAMAEDKGIPVFANSPCTVDDGALFAIGADFYEVGTIAGKLAVEVVRGKRGDEIGIKNVVPITVKFNHQLAKKLSDWNYNPKTKELVE